MVANIIIIILTLKTSHFNSYCRDMHTHSSRLHLVCHDAGSVEGGLPVHEQHITVLQVTIHLHAIIGWT